MTWCLGWALAYELNGVDWAWQQAPVEDPFAINVDDFPSSFDPIALEAVWKTAIRTWSVEGDAEIYLIDAGRTTVTRWGGGDDGTNATTFGGQDPGYGLATATWAVSGPDIIDCDIEIYRSNVAGTIPWHIDATTLAGPSDYDLLHTLIHEVGHCLGLGHSNAQQAIMFGISVPGTPEAKRHLTFDDQAGLLAMYGPPGSDLVVVDVTAPTLGAGETGALEVRVQNLGTGWAVDVLGVVAVGDGPLTAPIPGAGMGDVAPGGDVGTVEASLVFQLTVDEGCDVDVDVPVAIDLSTEHGPGPLAAVSVPVRCAVSTGDTGRRPDDTGPTDTGSGPPVETGTSPYTYDDGPPYDDVVMPSAGRCGCGTGAGAGAPSLLVGLLLARRRR